MFADDLDKVLEKQTKRLKVLRCIYFISDGITHEVITLCDHPEIIDIQGKELVHILEYLESEELIESLSPLWNGGSLDIKITHQGVIEIEAAITQPNQRTEHFVESVIMNFHGNVGAVQNGDRNVAHVTQNNYSQQNLTDAAREIQQLLDQLAKTYPINTQSEKLAVVTKAVEKIENDPSWKNRVVSAIKSGGTEGIKELLDNPLANILLAVIEGWREAK